MSEFTTKDSGERQTFESGMQRDTQKGKALYHLVYEGPMLDRWAELLTRGAEKYDENNWMKARGEAELRRFKASAARHFRQWMRGDTDEDHAAAVMFNVNGAEYVAQKMREARSEPDTNIRPNSPNGTGRARPTLVIGEKRMAHPPGRGYHWILLSVEGDHVLIASSDNECNARESVEKWTAREVYNY